MPSPASVPIEWLSLATDDFGGELVTRCINPRLCPEQLRMLEFCWGMQCFEFDPGNPLNRLKLRPEMNRLFPRWGLVPTEDTLRAILEFQQQNLACSIGNRRHFLQAFPPGEYEYRFLPWKVTEDLVVHPPHGPAITYSYPYLDLPNFRAVAHPLYLCVDLKAKAILSKHPIASEPWRTVYDTLSFQWLDFPPQDFLLPVYDTDSEVTSSDSDYESGIRSCEAKEDETANSEQNEQEKPSNTTERISEWMLSRKKFSAIEPEVEIVDPAQGEKVMSMAVASPRWRKETLLGRSWKYHIFGAED